MVWFISLSCIGVIDGWNITYQLLLKLCHHGIEYGLFM
uniref:Uncharacterized protein n=1 Tax=Manihot esculenta TaxID=3983 RepID=A0A2C9VGU5_MANES